MAKTRLSQSDWASIGYASCLMQQGVSRIEAIRLADAAYHTDLAATFPEPKPDAALVAAAERIRKPAEAFAGLGNVPDNHVLLQAIDRQLGKQLSVDERVARLFPRR